MKPVTDGQYQKIREFVAERVVKNHAEIIRTEIKEAADEAASYASRSTALRLIRNLSDNPATRMLETVRYNTLTTGEDGPETLHNLRALLGLVCLQALGSNDFRIIVDGADPGGHQTLAILGGIAVLYGMDDTVFREIATNTGTNPEFGLGSDAANLAARIGGEITYNQARTLCATFGAVGMGLPMMLAAVPTQDQRLDGLFTKLRDDGVGSVTAVALAAILAAFASTMNAEDGVYTRKLIREIVK